MSSFSSMANNVSQIQASQATPAQGDSSSEDSDNTIVNAEMLKQMNIPIDPTDSEGDIFGDSESSLGDGNTSTSTRGEGALADDEKSETKSDRESPIPPTQCSNTQHTNSPPSTQPVSKPVKSNHHTEQVAPISLLNVPESQKVPAQATRQQQVVITDASTVPAHIKLQIEQDLVERIRSNKKMKKALDKEISRRQALQQERAISNKSANNENINQNTQFDGPPGPSSALVSRRQLELALFSTDTTLQCKTNQTSTFSKIPKITLDISVIKSSLERVTKRRRLSTSYSALSEILKVKQILANGNPFRVIPQHAYNISNVPGIRLPHIQQLLRQWEIYFSNLLYQVVQIEYSIEYANVERRITTMVEGGDTYGALCKFQELVGKDEVNVAAFKPSPSPGLSSKQEEPVNKKNKKTHAVKSHNPSGSDPNKAFKKPRDPSAN